jgi:tetratricopeptide (TPR) repeat protein
MSTMSPYEQARELMNQGQLEEAASLFEKNIEERPHFKELELLGECFMLLGRLSQAIVPLAAATTLNRGVRAPSLLAEVLYLLGDMYAADQIAELALSRDPKNHKALEIRQLIAKASE